MSHNKWYIRAYNECALSHAAFSSKMILVSEDGGGLTSAEKVVILHFMKEDLLPPVFTDITYKANISNEKVSYNLGLSKIVEGGF